MFAPPSPSHEPRSLRLSGGLVLILLASLSIAIPRTVRGDAPFQLSPDLHEIVQLGEHGRTYCVMLIIFQVALMLLAAKLLGWLAERVRVPGVVGELLAGGLVGPYLLGSWIHLRVQGHWLPLFPRPTAPGQWPVNDVIWTLAQFASIVLLFLTGLHTDLKQFFRYIAPATLIAVAGLVAPFALGAALVYFPPFAALTRAAPGDSVLIPALFVGSILAATSIGITARVLSDINRLDTPEGVTILGAAVLDDVLGIIALAVVGGIASSGSVSASHVGAVAGKALGFWIGMTGILLLLARPIERALSRVRYRGALVGLSLALAFVCSAAAESFGLAFIIGAYSAGLGLSRTVIARKLTDELRPVGDFVVPIFFASLGMLVNFGPMLANTRVIVFGLALTVAAVVGKLLGCGAAARATGFNLRGAYRIGVGMVPRGEVALIVAGIGLSRGLIGDNVFLVSIMMTLLTTVLAPIFLVPAFARGGSGRKALGRRSAALPSISIQPGLLVRLAPDLAPVVLERLLKLAKARGWEPAYDRADEGIYLLRSAGDAAQVRLVDGTLHIDASDTRQPEFQVLLADARNSILHDAASLEPRTAVPHPREAL